MDTIAIAVIVAGIVVAAVYWFLKTKESNAGSIPIIGKTVDATQSITSSGTILPSMNQKEGMTFSYTAWMVFEDFTYRMGTQKVIFTKGAQDLSSMCPGVFLDSNTNTILVKIDTFGAQEVIPIPNIPAKKWVHFGLVVDQDSVDVYINGTLHTHHTLSQLPRQNPGPVHIGLNGGFKGSIADLKYYAYFLTPEQIKGTMTSVPQKNVEEPAAPPYSNVVWSIGTHD
jgi:hypothetical protein